MQGGGKGGNA